MYRENIFQDKTNKNGEEVVHFILAINIRLNEIKSQNFVPIITTLFEIIMYKFWVKTSKYKPYFYLSNTPIKFNGIH